MNVLVRITATVVTGAAFALAAAPAASSQSFPSSVAIERLSAGVWSFTGNGVLISDPTSSGGSHYVLTTEQLASSATPATLRVVAGVCDLTDQAGSQAAGVASWVPAPPLSVPPVAFPNDLALLTLASPLAYSPSVQPARLPYDTSINYEGETATVAGWWGTSPCGSVLSKICQQLTMEVLTKNVANSKLASFPGAIVGDDQLCLLDNPLLTETVLKGGSGAGVYVEECPGEWVLVGIASWGISSGFGCSLANYPFVTTRVSSYMDWIILETGITPGSLTWHDMHYGAVPGTPGIPLISGSGPMTPGSPNAVTLSNAKPGAFAALFVGFQTLNYPFAGGTLIPDFILPNGYLIQPLPVSSLGTYTFSFNLPSGIPACTNLYWQFVVVDPFAPMGKAMTDGLQVDIH
jgi:hypothetical protein